MKLFQGRKSISPFQMILLGFLAVILAGCLLLMLPFSTKAAGGASFFDALFTSTSAVCVTGLVVHDTASYWSGFGQGVILLLIEIGGMGVITIAGALAVVAGRKIGLFQRNTMQEALAAHSVGGIVRLTGFLLRASLVIELIGAAIMAPVFCRELGLAKGIWYALFHSISAFCNAGFDLMGAKAPFSSLTSFVGQPAINLTVAGLIVIGGLGFLTWDDIRMNRWHIKRYRMQSKVIFLVTGILIFVPTLYFYFVEFHLPQWAGLTGTQRVLAALFQAVSPRTAGFNTVDLSALSGTGQMLTIILMLIGGSPGSTAGGMKTTTVAVLVLSAVAVYRRNEDAQCFGRRIANSAVKSAAAILFIYLLLFLAGGMVISTLEGLPILTCLFEAASAVGTVGLTLGITTKLGAISRGILILLMYFGRVGGLTLIYATVSGKQTQAKYPQEKITVG